MSALVHLATHCIMRKTLRHLLVHIKVCKYRYIHIRTHALLYCIAFSITVVVNRSVTCEMKLIYVCDYIPLLTNCSFFRCIIYFYWTNKGSLEIALQARDPEEDDEFCYDQAVFVATILNDVDGIKSPATQYMLSASSASALRQESSLPPVDGGNQAGPGGTDASGAVIASLSFLSAMIAAFSLLLL